VTHVEQGDYLAKIAKRYGFADWRTIWNHPRNAALRNRRPNPNVLYPGDEVFVPERELKEVPGSTEQRHRFRVTRPRLRLAIVLDQMYKHPLASVDCVLRVEGREVAQLTDARGRIALDIPWDAHDALLVVRNSATALDEVAIPIRVGNLDPVEEESGQRGRLNNLGYFAGPFDDKDDGENEKAFRSAVEEFQCDYDLGVDGKCGPKTQAKLREVHGS
jgi:N-acetylmuramoyl-L-alanine amidase